MSRLPDDIQHAIQSFSWNLKDPPPMRFQSLEEMRQLRIPIFADIPATIERLSSSGTRSKDKEASYILARIAVSLLLLGNGFTDEAHDLVLGLSWRGELPYAYVDTSTSPNIHDEHLQTLACYAHCLIHRLEGPHPSEFGMTGFRNSDYWAGTTLRYLDVCMDQLPLHAIRASMPALP